MCLEMDYKTVFSVLVICKLHVNMYTDLKEIQRSLLLSAALSLRVTRKLSAQLARAPRRLSLPPLPASPPHHVLFLASPHLTAT